MDTLESLSQDEKTRREARAREDGRLMHTLALAETRHEGHEEGRAEGREEGREEGRIEFLKRMLERKFGEIPADYARQIESARPEQIDAWADRLFDAASIDAVFA